MAITLKCEPDHAALAAAHLGDGVFPLITNDRTLTERELLPAYKGRPVIEKRFAQLKTDFAVAPVFPKEVSRVQALLCMYSFVPLVESLVERELRLILEQLLDAARRSLYYDCVLLAVRLEGSDACIFASREESPRRFHGRSPIRSVRSVWQVC